MKVLHVVPGLDDPTCGIAVAAKMVARRQGAGGETVECVNFKAWTRQKIANADEVWVHSMWTPDVMRAAWSALWLGKKLVRMPHGCMDPVKRRHHWWKKMWVTPFEKWLFRKSDSVIATCEDEAKWIKDFEHLVKKVEVLSLGECVDFSRVERVERVGDEDGTMSLLFIGRLHPLKGVEFLLHAIKEYQSSMRSMRSLRLKIIGKDEGEGEKLKLLAKDFGLDVEFCGVVSEEEKERAWEWCDVLVLPTLSENFGLVVAEALERGKRVITTDGAPVWESLAVSGQELAVSGQELVVSGDGCEIGVGCGGRLLYLKGFRDGSDEKRVELLKKAILAVSS